MLAGDWHDAEQGAHAVFKSFKSLLYVQVKYMALNEAQFQDKFEGMFVSPDRAAELLKEVRSSSAVLRSPAWGKGAAAALHKPL